MNTDPDLPEVPTFRKVTAVADVKPFKGFTEVDGKDKRRRKTTEMNFRKKLLEAIAVLQKREARHGLAFEPVELDGALAVAMVDADGEQIGLMTAEEAVVRAETGSETAFFIDREC